MTASTSSLIVQNIALRGLSFALVSAFDFDSAWITVDGRREYGEVRYRAVGMLNGKVAVVVFTMRGKTVRVISLRLASKKERAAHEKTRRVRPTAADDDNPPWTAADFKRAKRVEDIPALAHLSKRKRGERGPQKAPKKTPVAIRLDADVVAHYRGKGPGWQSRINKDLRVAAKLVHR